MDHALPPPARLPDNLLRAFGLAFEPWLQFLLAMLVSDPRVVAWRVDVVEGGAGWKVTTPLLSLSVTP